MKHRFLEAEDAARTNHGKFSLLGYDPEDFAHPSPITGGPLLTTIPTARRFRGPITSTTLWLLDLQTQEGMLFDATAPERALRRRFLVHPLHVCILYWPLMRYLARPEVRDTLWMLPQRVTLPQGDVLDQPGLLVDATGAPVRGRWALEGWLWHLRATRHQNHAASSWAKHREDFGSLTVAARAMAVARVVDFGVTHEDAAELFKARIAARTLKERTETAKAQTAA